MVQGVDDYEGWERYDEEVGEWVPVGEMAEEEARAFWSPGSGIRRRVELLGRMVEIVEIEDWGAADMF